MRKKNLLVFMLTAAVTTGLFAGCGDETKTTTSGSSQVAETQKDNKTSQSDNKASQSESGEKTVIKVWTKDRADLPYVQGKLDEYNKNNKDGVEVDYQIYTDNYAQAIDMAVQSDELPDLMVYQSQAQVTKYIPNGQWADLYQLMDQEMKDAFKEVVYPGYNEIEGKLYYIPTFGTTNRLFYNTEIFDRVGIKEPPKTLQEMVEDAKLITSQLKGEGIYGFAQNMKGASSGLNRSFHIEMQRETGLVGGYNFKTGQYEFEKWADGIKLWTELLSEDSAFPGCESLDIDPLRTQFAAGKIGMYISFTHAEPGVYKNQFPMDTKKWDCAPIPTVDGKEVGKQSFGISLAYLINAKSENLEKAFNCYKNLFMTDDYLKGYYEGGYGITLLDRIRKNSKPSDDFQNKPYLQMTEREILLPLGPDSRYPGSLTIEGLNANKALESIYYGGEDADATLADLSKRYNAALKKGIDEGLGKELKDPNYDPMECIVHE